MNRTRSAVFAIWALAACGGKAPEASRGAQAEQLPASAPVRAVGQPTVVADSILLIPLGNGDTVVFVTNRHAEMETATYIYDGHLAGAPFHGVTAGYYELVNYILVHDSTGKRSVIDARPV